MRRVLLLATSALVLLLSVPALARADLVNQAEYGSRYETACFDWYDTEGTEQGSVLLCGWTYQNEWGSSSWVEAERHVQTCEDGGAYCVDAYSERYVGPAGPNEFSMDMVAGTASFDIVLSGEGPDDDCVVQVAGLASETYSYDGGYPTVYAHADPAFPYAWVRTGNRSVSAASGYGYTSVSDQTEEHTYRAASGTGSVCNWVTQQSSDGGGLWAQGSQTTSYWTATPYVPLPGL